MGPTDGTLSATEGAATIDPSTWPGLYLPYGA
jgi:hypothetical protein